MNTKDANEVEFKEGQRVRALIRVYDLPGPGFGPPTEEMLKKEGPFAAHIHAEPGDLGTIVHIAEEGAWPTVTFDRTGTTTDCTNKEVEVVQ